MNIDLLVVTVINIHGIELKTISDIDIVPSANKGVKPTIFIVVLICEAILIYKCRYTTMSGLQFFFQKSLRVNLDNL